MRKSFIDAMCQFGILSRSSSTTDQEGGSRMRPDVAKAKSIHSNAESALGEAQRRIEESKESLGKDWGLEWQFKRLDQTCLEYNYGE